MSTMGALRGIRAVVCSGHHGDLAFLPWSLLVTHPPRWNQLSPDVATHRRHAEPYILDTGDFNFILDPVCVVESLARLKTDRLTPR